MVTLSNDTRVVNNCQVIKERVICNKISQYKIIYLQFDIL